VGGRTVRSSGRASDFWWWERTPGRADGPGLRHSSPLTATYLSATYLPATYLPVTYLPVTYLPVTSTIFPSLPGCAKRS
jgi:hypothetical protein